MKKHPLVGFALIPFPGFSICTEFETNYYKTAPPSFDTIASTIAWLSAKTGAISDTIQITRHYAWKWIPSSLLSSWRYRPLDKDQLRETNPLLFILQGFCSVPLVGPSSCPLEYLDLTMKMQRERYVGNGPYCDRIGTDDSV